MQIAFWNRLRTGSWKRTTVGVLSALLLIPVPAMAFIFTDTNWTFVQRQVRAPAVVTTGTSDFANGGTLVLNMGFNGPNPSASDTSGYSVINASRRIQVGANGEKLQLAQSFETLLQGANIRVLVAAQRTDGALIPMSAPIVLRSGIKFAHVFNQSPVTTTTLAAGSYTLQVKIEYRKNRLGVWDNTPPRPGSPHTFAFTTVP